MRCPRCPTSEFGAAQCISNRKAKLVLTYSRQTPRQFKVQAKNVVGKPSPGYLGARTVVRPERFELPTYCSGGLAARQINNLARLAWSEIRLYLCGFLTPCPTAHPSENKRPLGTILGTVGTRESVVPLGVWLPRWVASVRSED